MLQSDRWLPLLSKLGKNTGQLLDVPKKEVGVLIQWLESFKSIHKEIRSVAISTGKVFLTAWSSVILYFNNSFSVLAANETDPKWRQQNLRSIKPIQQK